MTLNELRAKLSATIEQAQALQAQAEADGRDLTVEETAALTSALNDAENLKASIAGRERLAALTNTAPAGKSASKPAAKPASGLVNGFNDVNDFYKSVMTAADGPVDARLVNAFVGEGTGADGGYAVPPDFRQGVQTLITSPESLLSKCDVIYATSSSLTLPTDENADWDGTNGITAADVAEGATIGDSKVSIKQWTASLVKTAALVGVTDEMLQDVANIGSYVQTKTASKLDYKLSSKVFAAVMTSGSKLAIAKNGETAGSAPNMTSIIKMFQALHVGFQKNAVWLANINILSDLMALTLPGSTFPAYISPSQGLSAAPYGTLMGLPVIFHPLANARGAEGDLVLVDLSSVYAVLKSGGPKSTMSQHVRFLEDQSVFKTTVRAVFKSKLSGVITRPDTTTCSNIVTVAVR